MSYVPFCLSFRHFLHSMSSMICKWLNHLRLWYLHCCTYLVNNDILGINSIYLTAKLYNAFPMDHIWVWPMWQVPAIIYISSFIVSVLLQVFFLPKLGPFTGSLLKLVLSENILHGATTLFPSFANNHLSTL